MLQFPHVKLGRTLKQLSMLELDLCELVSLQSSKLWQMCQEISCIIKIIV